MTSVVHIVDDDESCRTATARLLSAYGLEVKSYESGDEFWLAFRVASLAAFSLTCRCQASPACRYNVNYANGRRVCRSSFSPERET
jgi:DNA-binding NtrC family response regulator